MAYKVRWTKTERGKRNIYESHKTFAKKSNAQKVVDKMRQMDDDLPKSQREKHLKTYRVVNAIAKKIIKRRLKK